MLHQHLSRSRPRNPRPTADLLFPATHSRRVPDGDARRAATVAYVFAAPGMVGWGLVVFLLLVVALVMVSSLHEGRRWPTAADLSIKAAVRLSPLALRHG